MRVLAIDPGSVSGAYAILGDGPTVVGDLPVVNGELNLPHVLRLFREAAAAVCVIERVGAMPGQGVSSTFKFGAAYGSLKMAAAAAMIPLELVTPPVWKAHFKLRKVEKDASRLLAVQKFPNLPGLHLKKHHGRADALLIALWKLEKAGKA